MYLKGFLEHCHLDWNKKKSAYNSLKVVRISLLRTQWQYKRHDEIHSQVCQQHLVDYIKHKWTEGIQELFVQGTKTYEFPMEKTRGENISWGGKKWSLLCHSFIPSIEDSFIEEKGKTSEHLLKMALSAHCDSCCYRCLLQISTTTNRDGTIPVTVGYNTMKKIYQEALVLK